MCEEELYLENNYLKKWHIKNFPVFITKIKVIFGLLRYRQNMAKVYFYKKNILSFSKLGWTKSNAEKDDS